MEASACHIILTEPMRERQACNYLEKRNLPCYMPIEPVSRTRGIRRAKVKGFRPIFRGYLFSPISNIDVMWMIMRAPGIRHVMLREGEYAVIPASAMALMMEIERQLLNPAAPFKTGDRVQHIDRLLEDHVLTVESFDIRSGLVLLLNLLGSQVRMRGVAPEDVMMCAIA